MSTPQPNENPTQLIRYVLQIDQMTDDTAISQVRTQLTQLGLLVDRIQPGEAEVAVAQGTNPGPEGIARALKAIGYTLVDSSAQTG